MWYLVWIDPEHHFFKSNFFNLGGQKPETTTTTTTTSSSSTTTTQIPVTCLRWGWTSCNLSGHGGSPWWWAWCVQSTDWSPHCHHHSRDHPPDHPRSLWGCDGQAPGSWLMMVVWCDPHWLARTSVRLQATTNSVSAQTQALPRRLLQQIFRGLLKTFFVGSLDFYLQGGSVSCEYKLEIIKIIFLWIRKW